MPPRKKLEGTDVIEKLLNNGQLMRGDDERLVIHRIPTGLPDLDRILNGGIPRHRITIFVGQYSSGKSFLVQMFLKHCLEQGLQVAYIDTEQTYDPEWWAQIGLPLDKVLVSQPTIGEDGVDIAVALARAGVDVIAIDSLAALVPHEEFETTEQTAEGKEGTGSRKKFIGLQARLISKLMRLLLAVKHNSAIVCVNQLRDAIGGPTPFEVMPGGMAQGFLMSLLIRTQRTGWIEENGKRVGFNIRMVCRKSKVGTPFGECELPFLFRGEFDVLSLLIDRGIESGLIEQKGPYYVFKFGENSGESILGRNTVIAKLTEDKELQGHLQRALGEL